MTITLQDIEYRYICIDCYTAYQIEIQNLGSSSIVFSFGSEDDALAHLEDGNEPTHSLTWQAIRRQL